jgi:transposase InsO family protein
LNGGQTDTITRVRSPQTNGVVARFFGTLKYEHLYCATIGDSNALAVGHCDERVAVGGPAT